MKIIAKIPEQKHFKRIGRSERWAYVLEAISTPKIRLYSPVADPWAMGETWAIQIRESKGKSDKSQYTNRIDFQLFLSFEENDEAVKAKIIWEVSKGIGHSNRPTLRFYAIPFLNSQEQPVNLLLSIINLQ